MKEEMSGAMELDDSLLDAVHGGIGGTDCAVPAENPGGGGSYPQNWLTVIEHAITYDNVAEEVSVLAITYHTTVGAILLVNGLSSVSQLSPGQIIRIPARVNS